MNDSIQRNEQAVRLLAEASFAAALYAPTTAVSLSRSLADRALWRDDEKIMRALHAQSEVNRATTKDSILVPMLRSIVRSSSKRTIKSAKECSAAATASRRDIFFNANSDHSTHRWVDYNTPVDEWPKDENGVDKSPIQMALEPSQGWMELLCPYQYQASGVIEMVRAAGTVIGICDGDNLAQEFMKMILAFGGETVAETVDGEEPLSADISLLAGGFIMKAANGWDKPSSPLTGPQQHLAIAILAAWLRMSTLGVRLTALNRLQDWENWFDGIHYSGREEWIGEVWSMNDADSAEALNRVELQGKWANPSRNGQLPWQEREGGSPNVFVGIASALLDIASTKTGVYRDVSDGFFQVFQEDEWKMPEHRFDLPKSVENDNIVNDKIAIQLEKIRGELVNATNGAVKSIRLLEHLS